MHLIGMSMRFSLLSVFEICFSVLPCQRVNPAFFVFSELRV